MKKLLLLLSLLPFINASAQDDLHCATDRVMRQVYEMHPELKAKKAAADAATSKIVSTQSTASYRIPVVFHILHQDGPENISDAQVIDALNILNRDYAKRNADTASIIPSFQALADSTGIQFALATKDPNGNCTSGIVHYYDTDTDWNDQSPTIYSHTWDPTRYLNVYVVRTITLTGGFSAAGYTYFPGTFSAGDPYDAIVVLNSYFGSIGTGHAFQSRVLTHEVGHWLDVYHVFGATNGAGVDCSGDDFVNDTPPTPGYLICPNPANPSEYQLCNSGVDENFQNYMDYSYCCRMFTPGQVARMHAALNNGIVGRNNLWTTGNLTSTGVINPSSTCAPVADFTYDRSLACVGTPVTFADASWNGTPTGYSWSFPGGTPSTSNVASPVVTYSTPGVYSVTYTSSNSAGTSAPVTHTNIITITSTTAMYNGNWSEGFETHTLPGSDWTVANSSGGANWVQSFDAAYTGFASAELPLISNMRNAVTSMTSPSLNLSTLTSPALTFRLAAAESNPNHVNNLKVMASTDCGLTWTQLYSKTGSTLITTNTTASPFIPMTLNEWRQETVSLASIASATSARIQFVYTRDTIPAPNNIFIDDINISGTNGIGETENGFDFTLFPNPSEGQVQIAFTLAEKHHATITLTDLLGRAIETIADENLQPGVHQFNNSGKPDAGTYFLTIDLDGVRTTKKVVMK